jgi:hypothetical protein
MTTRDLSAGRMDRPRRRGPRHLLLASLALLAGLGAGEARAQTVPSAEPGWRFSATPYVWAPSVSGTLRYSPLLQQATGASGAKVDVSATSILDDLKFAAMISGEARYGRFTFAADFIYLSLGSAHSGVRSVDFIDVGRNAVSSSANAGTQSSIKGTVITVAPGYTLAQGSWGHVDGQLGFRVLGLSTETSVRLGADIMGPRAGMSFSRQGQLSRSDTLIDGIVGLRGRFFLGRGFSLPYALDVGTGSSRLTWQASGGVAYQTGWAGVTVGYRHLAYEAGGNSLVQDFSFGGPFIALNMTF